MEENPISFCTIFQHIAFIISLYLIQLYHLKKRVSIIPQLQIRYNLKTNPAFFPAYCHLFRSYLLQIDTDFTVQ